MTGCASTSSFKSAKSPNASLLRRGRHSSNRKVLRLASLSNEFHEAVWEFLRNDKLDARDFFDKKDTGRKTPFRRNQFGATTGGPVLHDRTFFFFAYEGIRRRQLFTSLQQVPTEAFLRG